MTEMRQLLASLLVALLATGCTVGPDYKRPETHVPGRYSEAATQPATVPAAAPAPS